MHTVKRRIPFRLAIIPALLVALPLVLWWGWRSYHGIGSPSPATASMITAPGAVPVLSSSSTPGQGSRPQFRTIEDYAQWHVPRIASMPWSAPWHDQSQPVAQPDIYCVQTEVKCQCYTEQITRLSVPLLECIQVAKFGVYNPYRRPQERREQPQRQGTPPPSRTAARRHLE